MTRHPRCSRRCGRSRTFLAVAAVPLLSAAILLAGAPRALAAPPPIVLDGSFDDWVDRIQFTDTYWKDEPRDQQSINFIEDIQYAYFGTNPGEPWLFFRVDRFPKGGAPGPGTGIRQPVYYSVYFDMSNEHDFKSFDRFQGYQEANDYVLYCSYTPVTEEDESNVQVYLVPAPAVFGPGIKELDVDSIVWEAEGDWGQPYDGGEGGLIAEFGVPFSAFGSDFSVGQTIQFFFAASLHGPLKKITYPQQDFCPDEGGIQDAPISTLGTVGTILLLAAALGIACYSIFHGRLPKARGGEVRA